MARRAKADQRAGLSAHAAVSQGSPATMEADLAQFERDQPAQARLTAAVAKALAGKRRTGPGHGVAGKADGPSNVRSEELMENMNLMMTTTQIVSAYVSAHKIDAQRIDELIQTVFAALSPQPVPVEDQSLEKLTPAQIRKSITPDHLISFEDGKAYKTLKRHLTLRGLTPMEYKTKWGLSFDYPMTSANYTARRSELAKSLGLGAKGRTARSKGSSKAPRK